MNKLKRKFQKLTNKPSLFFKDAFLNFKLKKHKKSTVINPSIIKKHDSKFNFVIICPTYNVEKYIDDFFNSILTQTLNFKNIHIIFVDDGSTDSSAKKITLYQENYPNNITYLHKENGGLSDARNYGLNYLDDNNIKFDFVTFTDPDDILDKDYFRNLDSFFSQHPNCDIASCNLIYFYEKDGTFKDIHPLKYRYNKTHIVTNNDFGKDILLSAATSVYKLSTILNSGIRFDKNLKPSFEDCKFNSQLITVVPNIQVGFVKESRYLYRQREDSSSLMNGSWKNENLFTTVPNKGVISILQLAYDMFGFVPKHIQRVALFHCIGYYRRLINAEYHIDFLNTKQKEIFIKDLETIFSFIDSDTIIECEFPNLERKIKSGLLGFYKKTSMPIHYTYVNHIDRYNKEFTISYFSYNQDEKLQVKLNNKDINIIEEKFISNNFIGKVFFYERRFRFNYTDPTQELMIFINSKKVNLTCFSKGYTGGAIITELLASKRKNTIFPNFKDSWILMDRKDKADDNAEHFYRYLKKNHPSHEIYFVLKKDCKDWKRLSEEGFNLLDYDSKEFTRELIHSKYIISSHLFIWNHLISQGSVALANKRKIWLQHGVICNNNSNVVNTKQMDFMVTSTQPEYDSIAANGTDYNLFPSQVLLSGLPRHDTLLEKEKSIEKEKLILVMPTWRTWLNEENILESQYFSKWVSLLESKKLTSLLEKYNYKLVFAPHQELDKYKSLFIKNDNIYLWDSEESMQDLFLRASLMITDYSSVAFEMGFLNKCVFYYQFDQNEFYSKHYRKGYFDFYKNGFGPVLDEEDVLIKELNNYLENPIQFEQHFKDRMNVFIHKDGKSCERIYNKIISLDIAK